MVLADSFQFRLFYGSVHTCGFRGSVPHGNITERSIITIRTFDGGNGGAAAARSRERERRTRPGTARVTQRVTGRARSGAAAAPWQNAGAVATLGRSRPTSSCLPTEKPEAVSKTPGRPVSETEPARVPGLPFRQPVSLRTRICRRSERPASPRASCPAPQRQGDSGTPASPSLRPRGQHWAPAGQRRGTRPHPARPGPPRPRPRPPPRPQRYLPPALLRGRLSAAPCPHARRHRCARAPAPPTWAGCRRAAPLRPARGQGVAAPRERAPVSCSAAAGGRCKLCFGGTEEACGAIQCCRAALPHPACRSRYETPAGALKVLAKPSPTLPKSLLNSLSAPFGTSAQTNPLRPL